MATCDGDHVDRAKLFRVAMYFPVAGLVLAAVDVALIAADAMRPVRCSESGLVMLAGTMADPR